MGCECMNHFVVGIAFGSTIGFFIISKLKEKK